MVQNMKFKVYHMTNIRNRIWNIICSQILKQGCENLIFWWCAPAHIRVGSCQKRPVETFAKAKVVLDDNSFYATKSLLYSRPRFFDILKLCYSINAPWWWPSCENLIFWWCAPLAHIRVGSCRPVETFEETKVVLDDNSCYAIKSLLDSRLESLDILKLCYSINAPWWWPRTLMMTCFFLIRLFLLPCCSLPTKKHYFYTNIIKKKPSKKISKVLIY